ncbi:alpha/beta fold hydrolase [Hydrogenophaga pseudoflava]|uniref:alpha/beta fold hydrolase n=1 Tax=Hydrogenophaga pseudoflava TaxID=47421 RepID=UPI0027E42615|nr:alpha/beta fold hydrolase [Hydrogenophaga pseudoflava]MDQ7743968.1 alpha/beta fold hydrolase [Hydrogenophaga pseudoflava]
MSDWVFLRGLTRESAHWGDFPARFEAALPGARVHLIDLPGNGARRGERSPATVADIVADVRAQRHRLGIAGPVHLLALSLGAMVATQWLHSAPQDIASSVLVNTSMRPFSPLHHRLQPHNLPTLLRLLVGRASPEAAERLIWRMTSARSPVDEAVLAAWVAARVLRPVQAANALRQLLAAARFRAPHGAPPRPVLLLTSRGDRLVHSRCSQALARAWGCPLAQHPDAGHDLPLDDPDWVIARVREWVAHMNPA